MGGEPETRVVIAAVWWARRTGNGDVWHQKNGESARIPCYNKLAYVVSENRLWPVCFIEWETITSSLTNTYACVALIWFAVRRREDGTKHNDFTVHLFVKNIFIFTLFRFKHYYFGYRTIALKNSVLSTFEVLNRLVTRSKCGLPICFKKIAFR